MSTVDNTGIVGTKTGPQLVTEIQTQFGNTDTELDLLGKKADNVTITGDWTFADIVCESFTSTGIDDNATSVQVTVEDTEVTFAANVVITGTVSGDGSLLTGIEPTKYLGQNLQTDDYELVLLDAGKIIDMNKATAVTLTIPANTAVAFPVNTRIDINQEGAGLLTVAITTDTLRGDPVSQGQYKGLSLWKRAATEWVLYGGTTA